MNNEKIEILLIELSGASLKNKLSTRHSISRSAPIGLYCLKAISPEHIGIIDVPVSQIKDMFSIYISSPIKTIICRLAENPDIEEIKSIISSIKENFPKSNLGCNLIQSDITKEFDFVDDGTGKTTIELILGGQSISGHLNHIEKDLQNHLSIPEEPLIDVGYTILPEKWLSVHNLEIWQPWLGLAEFSTTIFEYPGTDWMTKFLTWLSCSGFDSFHFNPSKWTVDEINILRNIYNNLNINLSISFLNKNPINYSEILLPVKRIWIYYPRAIELEDVINKLKTIKASGFEACLQIDKTWFAKGATLPACKYIDHIIVNDDYQWNNSDYKKFTQRYWGTKNRFFTRLLDIRTASGLINFLKISYAILDTLFLPDNKGDQK